MGIFRARRPFVDPKLVKYVMEHPDTDRFLPEEREMSVVFANISGFTTISDPVQEGELLARRDYLGLMHSVIRKHRGVFNQVHGNRTMFFFGAPEPYPGDPTFHATAAVQTAMEMQSEIANFAVKISRENPTTLKLRAGISSGMMTAGDIGIPLRCDYTVIGDRVNIAAGLELANQFTGTQTLITEETVKFLRGRFLIRPIGLLQLFSRNELVRVYEPIAPMDIATDDQHTLVSMTQTLVEHFIAARFADCIKATDELLIAFGEASHGKLCELYCRLCMEHLDRPPDKFRGQIRIAAESP